MAVIQLEALRALRAEFEAAAPKLAGHVHAGQAPASEDLHTPCAAVIPVRRTLHPDQESVHHDPADASEPVVVEAGRHEAIVQIQIIGGTVYQRAELEQQILARFFAEEGRPGIMTTTVVSAPEFSEFLASWELDEDQWQDARGFDRQHHSVATVTGIVPALVLRDGVPRIEDLRLGLSHDFEADAGAAYNAATVIRVLEDGTFETL